MSDQTSPMRRLIRLVTGALFPPPGARRILLAYLYGAICHAIFALAVIAMIVAMFFGMSESSGRVPYPWAILANAALILQFPIVHSLLLTKRGGKVLTALAPARHAGTLATTSFAIVAAIQLLALFALWTPSGIVWWRAEGWAFWAICAAYAGSWLLLMRSNYAAGVEVQSGALGWMSLAADRKPEFPAMPDTGPFRVIRQPIYVAFALTTWTVPVWTPDQLALAVTLTAYCLLAPRLKEKRYARRYGDRFRAYQQRVPYAIPDLTRPPLPKEGLDG
ncbi:methyltransferase family protein [Jannaschia ovalis]|uniref:Isoprenylcysteine carboxylmethyltransferase family protein n=1 Tax=Jannaschia ovalis TaxID=3038773 RepID=A0ABY8LEA4_9RHOB|nr:isoprenylcysteine carboxylmethyltransferase family protein [Jannaschia sp. GRR-S6-38]WGH79646.1 isoprenylcysteine carboxylmethyltransferase family protein [Jannaschia sp. GRR-S6-38]